MWFQIRRFFLFPYKSLCKTCDPWGPKGDNLNSNIYIYINIYNAPLIKARVIIESSVGLSLGHHDHSCYLVGSPSHEKNF